MKNKKLVAQMFLLSAMLFMVSVKIGFAQSNLSPDISSAIDQMQGLQNQLQPNTSLSQDGNSQDQNTISGQIHFKNPLHKGERGQEILDLQKILIAKGLLSATTTPTGFFGSATQKAVQQLQNENGIANADGSTVGPKTQSLLENIITELGGVIPSDPTSFSQESDTQQSRNSDSVGGDRNFRIHPCGPGALYNSMTGQTCPAPKAVLSCAQGDRFDALTGKACSAAINSQSTTKPIQ